MSEAAPKEAVVGRINDLKKVRSASDFLMEQWPIDKDPTTWDGIKVSNDRVTVFKLAGSAKVPNMLPELPPEIGHLVALTTMELNWCRKLTALPAEIGNLVALQSLSIIGCLYLAELPSSIGQLIALTTLDINGCRQLTTIPASIGNLSNLRSLKMANCLGLTSLPGEVGKLSTLKTLNVSGCELLEELPVEWGQMVGLTTVHLDKCEKMKLPPAAIHKRPADEVIGFLAAHLIVTRQTYALPASKWLLERPKAVAAFITNIISDPVHAPKLGMVIESHPEIADKLGPNGERLIDIACKECKQAMQGALYLLDRFEVDSGAPLHLTASSAVVAATDRVTSGLKGLQRRALKAMRDEAAVLTELKGRLGIDNGFVVPILTVYVDASMPNMAYEGKVPIERVAGLGQKLANMVRKRRSATGALAVEDLAKVSTADGSKKRQSGVSVNADEAARIASREDVCEGYRYLVVLKLADTNLADVLCHERIGGVDFMQARKIATDLAKALDRLHSQKRIHGDVKPLNAVRLGTSWQLIDLDVSCKIERKFGEKPPSSAYCPPEMARVLLKGQLKSYATSIAYDLWSFGCLLYHLVFGGPVRLCAQRAGAHELPSMGRQRPCPRI